MNSNPNYISVPSQSTRVLDIILKVTERCNLACPYCYFFFGGDDSFNSHPPTIKDDVIENLIRFITDSVRNNGVLLVTVTFHGGEPLLLKKKRFEQICKKLKDSLSPICTLRLGIQTNGVLIDAEWVNIFTKHSVRIGMSIDGPKELHDNTRLDKSGRGTYDQTLRGWRLVREAADSGYIPYVGNLTVVNPEYSGEEIFFHLADDLKSNSMDFLLQDLTHDSPPLNDDYIEKCGEFLVGVIKGWSKYKKRKVRVRFLSHIVRVLLSDKIAMESIDERGLAPLSLLVVSSNGEISPNDTLRGLAPRFRNTGMNVKTHRLCDIWRSPIWYELWETHKNLPDKCSTCWWRLTCAGGPQFTHRFSQKNGFDNPSVYCSALMRINELITKQAIASGYKRDTIEERLMMGREKKYLHGWSTTQ